MSDNIIHVSDDSFEQEVLQSEMPVLIDSAGDLADLFGAKMTTTTVVIDANNVVQYWGQFQQGDNALAAEAIEAVLAGKKPLQEHTRERG